MYEIQFIIYGDPRYGRMMTDRKHNDRPTPAAPDIRSATGKFQQYILTPI